MENLETTYNHKGRDYMDLVPDRLSIEEISNCVKASECGAISLFIGTTRDNFNGLKVVSLHYEAYKSMALKILKDICNNLRENWPDIVNIAIYHRLGNVPVTEASVIIAVSSPHRQSSLSAVEHAINKLKELAPIWKKEEYAEGQSEAQWKENAESRATSEEDNPVIPDASMIQINSTHDEVFANIQSFLAYRKKLNSRDNIKTFCQRNAAERPPYSCSRVDAVSHRTIVTQAEEQYRKEHYDDIPTLEAHQSNSRIKQSSTPEEAGSRQQNPVQGKNMTRVQEPDHLSSEHIRQLLRESTTIKHIPLGQHADVSFGVRERLLVLEDHVGVSPAGDVYARLKNIEDRLMRIEDDCEEYLKMKNYFNKDKSLHKDAKRIFPPQECIEKKVFSIEDIDEKILNLREQLSSLARNNSSDMSEDEDNS